MQGYNGSQCWDTTFAVQVGAACAELPWVSWGMGLREYWQLVRSTWIQRAAAAAALIRGVLRLPLILAMQLTLSHATSAGHHLHRPGFGVLPVPAQGPRIRGQEPGKLLCCRFQLTI